MSGVWLPPGKQRFVDPLTGEAMVGGLVYHYIPGTDTPKNTWADEDQLVLNTNPIVLDAGGECTIWGDGIYRQLLQRADTTQVWDQVTGFAGGGGGSVTFASAGQVAAGVSPDTVVSPKALRDSGVLTIPVASPAEVLAGALNTKFITPFALSNSGLVPIKATAGEVAALTNDTKFITPKALGDSGVLGGGGSSAIVAVTQFGFIGDGVTDNLPFFAAMIASTSWDMYVPTGTFYISGSGPAARAQMKKRFWGPGKFLLGDGYLMPGRFSQITTKPSPLSGNGVGAWFGGDSISNEEEWHILGPGTRISTTEQYFLGCVIPHNIWYDVGSGASGMLARATGALVAGAGSAALNSVEGISVGQVLAVTPWGQDGPVTDTITIDVVNTGPKTIVFHPNLTTNYPNVVPNGVAPGLATFFAGKRTWNGVGYAKVTGGIEGGGDFYWAAGRMSMNYVPKAGQVHVFNTATMGITGGDMNFGPNTSGTMATGWENQINDQGNDVSGLAFVDSLYRSNDAGARSVTWVGHTFQSGGTRPVDVVQIGRGLFRWGSDFSLATMEDSTTLVDPIVAGASAAKLTTVRGVQLLETLNFCDPSGAILETKTVSTCDYATGIVTLSTPFAFSYAAGNRVRINHGGGGINLSLGQTAMVFNSTASNNARSGDPSGVYGPAYGNVTGDLVMRSGNDGSPTIGDFWQVQFNRNSPENGRLRLRPTVVQTNVQIISAGSITSGGDVVVAVNRILAFGPASGIYFQPIAGHLYVTIDGGGSFGLVR